MGPEIRREIFESPCRGEAAVDTSGQVMEGVAPSILDAGVSDGDGHGDAMDGGRARGGGSSKAARGVAPMT